MNYIKQYKIFELSNIWSSLGLEYSELFNEMLNEIEDINVQISEEDKIKYNNDSKLSLFPHDKGEILDRLLIGNQYANQLIILQSTKSIYATGSVFIGKLKRMCSYLSSKYNIKLDVIYIFDFYIISSELLTSILDWIYYFEYIESKSTFCKIQDPDSENDRLKPMYDKWIILSDMDFLFNLMRSSQESSWSSARSFNGFFVYVTNKDKNKILVFRFDRGDIIDEDMKYKVDIYFDTISPTHKSLPLPQLILKSESNFTKVENFNITFNVYDTEGSDENFYKILIDKTIDLFKIEKINLLNKISNILEDVNEYFIAEEINVYLEDISYGVKVPKLGVVQFVIMSDNFDNDKIFKIYVDDDLNMYINSIKEENKTSLEELIHDIYLVLVEKDKKMFENSHQYYIEISKIEYYNSIFGRGVDESCVQNDFILEKWDKFTHIEISKIMKFFPKHSSYVYSYIYGDTTYDNFGELCVLRKLSVVKLKDEWYYICVPNQRPVKNRDESTTFNASYWKCDQFDGLIDFIKKEIK